MNLLLPSFMCERAGMKRNLSRFNAAGLALWLTGVSVGAQPTNPPAGTHAPATTNAPIAAKPAPVPRPSPSAKLEEADFRIVSERNIFNANRSGGQVRLATRRAARVESFTLVGTMAYEKGTFAFFEGSSSEFTKAVKTDGVIAGYKLKHINTTGVQLEADGKTVDLPMGAAMRREDEGTWHLGEGVSGGGSSSTVASRENDSASRSSRSSGRYDSRTRRSDSNERGESGTPAAAAPPAASASTTSTADQSEILKRLMERREKE